MNQHRPSLTPSQFTDEMCMEITVEIYRTIEEPDVVVKVMPKIGGILEDLRCVRHDLLFNNLASLTDGEITFGKPDIYHGVLPERLSRDIRDGLSKFICPSMEEDKPLLPNFFAALKGQKGTPVVALRQALYHGCLGTRAMFACHSFAAGAPSYDGNAYTITSSFCNGLLKIYSSHFTQRHGRTVCSTTLLNSFPVEPPPKVREAVRAYRNLRDWAKEQRTKAIDMVNEAIDRQPRPEAYTIRLQAVPTSVELNSVIGTDRRTVVSKRPVQLSHIATDSKRVKRRKRVVEPSLQSNRQSTKTSRYSLRPRMVNGQRNDAPCTGQ